MVGRISLTQLALRLRPFRTHSSGPERFEFGLLCARVACCNPWSFTQAKLTIVAVTTVTFGYK